MAYLNDVEEGGETAFPAADNATYDYNVSVTINLCLSYVLQGKLSHFVVYPTKVLICVGRKCSV